MLMEEVSLGKQFSGLNCINYDELNMKWLLMRAQTEEKKKWEDNQQDQNYSFCVLSFRV